MVREHGLCLHEFAFLRACLQGIDVAKAATRYFPEGYTDPRSARVLLQRQLQLVQQQLVGLGEPVMAKALDRALQQTVVGAGSTVQHLPSLEDFAAEFDSDMYSERELLELYEERFGERHAEPLRPQDAVVAVNHLQVRSAVEPTPVDPVARWFSPGLAKLFHGLGVLTLESCAVFVNAGGRGWYKAVPLLGRARALRVVQWLLDHERFIGVPLSQRIRGVVTVDAEMFQKPHSLPDARPSTGTKCSVEPSTMFQLLLPQVSLRTRGPNALGAENDLQAIQTWLATLALKSPHTQRAYGRDLDRLLLWVQDRGKTLSTLTVDDALDHVHFLQDPPSHWINKMPTTRSAGDWKPMRGPLSQGSTNRALAAIGRMYAFLVATHYLVANPFAQLGQVRSASVKIDTLRSFTRKHQQAIQQALARLEEGPKRRRLVAVLQLLEVTGLRRSEANLTWGDITPMRIGEADHPCFKIQGKGMRERIIPIRPTLLAALEAHYADRALLVQRGVLVACSRPQTPLVSILETPLGSRADCIPPGAGALSGAGLYRVLKVFFHSVAMQTNDAQMRQDFERASCHWLRHTFAHEVLRASGQDLPVAQQLLGHTSLATTGIYVKADLSSRLDAVLSMRDAFASPGEGA